MPPFVSKFNDDLMMKLTRIRGYLAIHKEEREHLGNCPVCGANIKDRTVTLYKGLMRDLYKVYLYLLKNGKHEFNIKEVKGLLGKNEYARFGDLVRFGGVIYKPSEQKGLFGMNMERAEGFFKGTYRIPLQIVLNQITNKIESSTYATIRDFPELKALLTVDGRYDPNLIIE